MKRLTFALLAATAFLAAQDADRITVPFSNPSGAKTVRVDVFQGDVTIRAYGGNEVTVEMKGRHAQRRGRRSKELEGLKRIDISGGGLAVEERDNVVSINAPVQAGGDDLVIQVPVNTTLRAKSMNGDITVDGVHGEIELNSTNGKLKATNIEGAVVAHSLNGEINVTINRLDPKPMSFSSLNGEIDLTVPVNTKARLKMKADHGDVYTDFEIKLEPTTQRVEQNSKEGGRYKVKIEKMVYGTINGGGPEIALTTMNGEIRLRQKK